MISVIIPTRNRIEDLLLCLGALAKQENREVLLLEVIVCEDNPTQSCEQEIRSFAKDHLLPLVYLRSQGRGAAVARNHAANSARGSILAFLDDDSFPTETWLTTINLEITQNFKAVITGRILAFDTQSIFSRARQLRYDMRVHSAMKHPDNIGFLAGGNFAIRRDIFVEIGGFDCSFEMMHDNELALRLMRSHHPTSFIYDMLVYHRHYKGIQMAFRGSFQSAYWRLQMEQYYQELSPWTPQRQVQSLWQLTSNAGFSPKLLVPTIVASLLELIHSVGYIYYRSHT